jgi:hypothetical protein
MQLSVDFVLVESAVCTVKCLWLCLACLRLSALLKPRLVSVFIR